MRRFSLDVWLWTVSTEDWRVGTTTATILRRAVGVSSGDVLVMHDGMGIRSDETLSDRSPTVNALGELVRLVRGQGLDFATL